MEEEVGYPQVLSKQTRIFFILEIKSSLWIDFDFSGIFFFSCPLIKSPLVQKNAQKPLKALRKFFTFYINKAF